MEGPGAKTGCHWPEFSVRSTEPPLRRAEKGLTPQGYYPVQLQAPSVTQLPPPPPPFQNQCDRYVSNGSSSSNVT